MRTLLAFLIILMSSAGFGQTEIWPQDSLWEYEGNIVPVYTKEYLNKYNRMKKIVVKVYPYALHAADIIDEIDENAAKIERRRKKNKFYRESYKELKQNFKYFILDLYTSEGQMLMKLIHRETGMTVYDISNKYRGKQKAEMFNLMAKVWDQDLHVKFNPKAGDDKIVEQVIMDIQSGLVPFNDEIVTIDKLTYRDKQKADKERREKRIKRKTENTVKRNVKRNAEKNKMIRKRQRHS